MTEDDLKRTFGAAMMVAKEGCCLTCDALVRMRRHFEARLTVDAPPLRTIEAPPPPPPPAPASVGY